MQYKAIQRFCDGEGGKPFPKDKGGVTYEIGDVYPIEGFEPTNKHIKYLLGCNFQAKGPVIEQVELTAAEEADRKAAAAQEGEKVKEPQGTLPNNEPEA